MKMQTQAGISGAGDSADELVAIADLEFRAVENSLPSDPLARFAIFLEVTRTVDYWAVVQEALPDDRRLKAYDFDLVQWGWNPACALLLFPLTRAGGIPMQESTPQARAYAMALLHQLGRSILLRRAADMVRFGILACEKSQGEHRLFQAQPSSATQFLDTLEFARLQKLEMSKDKTPGAVRTWVRDDIETLMRPLIHPWDSGRGIMMGYGALPEVDNHFLAEALKMVLDWRDEAGIHPDLSPGESSKNG